MTEMQADFNDAHDRHWQDAEQLFAVNRWANADHLFGLAAECGLKRLMLAFGMKFDGIRDRPLNRDDWVHADGAWPRFESYRSGHHRGTAYALSAANPFADWSVSQRYSAQRHFDAARATAHRSATMQVRQLLMQATREGLI